MKDALGRHGEDLAAAYLIAEGLAILSRNWRCRDGEIDIIARDADALVFCEVKTRSSVRYGTPAEAITAVKASRIRRLALRWLVENREGEQSGFWPELRFDVVTVLRRGDGAPQIDHLRGAF